MKFFEKVSGFFKEKKPEKKSVPRIPQASLESPGSLEHFIQQVKRIITTSNSKVSGVLTINKLISRTDKSILDEMVQTVRKTLNDTDYVEDLGSEMTEYFISFRASLLNPIYKKTKSKRLARLMMFMFSLAPDLLKEKKNMSMLEDGSLSSEVELEELMTDLSLFNLSDKEIRYTVGRIMEYNEKNVTYTNEEIIFLNNSEILREFLEKLTLDVQEFVHSCIDWEHYFKPDIIGIPLYKTKVFNSDMTHAFSGEFGKSQFFDIVIEKNIKEELRPNVLKTYSGLFEQNLQTVVQYIKNAVLSENLHFIETFRQHMVWNIVLLYELDELPPYAVLNSLLSKSLKFHQNYYPDLIKALSAEKAKLLKILKEDYSGLISFKLVYDREVTAGMVAYLKQVEKETVDYQTFVSQLSVHTQKKEEIQSYYTSQEYFPEELSFLKRSPEAEVGIIKMNDNVLRAEKGFPIFQGEYFFTDKQGFLKSILLKTLLTLMDENISLKTLKSLLLKSLDRTKGESSEIMEKLIVSLKEEGFKRDLLDKLSKKQLKKHHVTTLIKRKVAENKQWEWIVAFEDPVIRLEKFSKVTGLSFFTLKNSKGFFKITAAYKDGIWSISSINRAGE